MCGICGCVVKNGRLSAEQARSATQAMCKALGHRGPDGSGILTAGNLHLGHTRLSVIDVEHAAQPMTAAGSRLAVSYNGEIYNFRQLAYEERQRGWEFETRSDTEALLAAFAHDGVECDARLNGMYAFAAYDGRFDRELLYLATDPVGIKPLFVYDGPDCILFASELRAIIRAMRNMGIEIDLDAQGLQSYFANGYVAAPSTMISDVVRLVPGGRATIDLQAGTLAMLDRRQRPMTPIRTRTRTELLNELRSTLGKAVERQLVADVSLGIFLSGGIDSSLVLALAAEQGHRPDCFTIGFAGQGHGVARSDESAVARRVAGHFAAKMHEIEVTPDYMAGLLDPTMAAMDQPLADAACLPLFALAGAARKEITVALSGDGGDELFAGYLRHRLARPKMLWSALPQPLKFATRRLVEFLPESTGGAVTDRLRRARLAFQMLDDPAYVRGPLDAFAMQSRPDLYNEINEVSGLALMNADIDGQLAGQMLMKTDNMTMAHSLECRVPMLDLEMVALASSIPISEKQSWRQGKTPLRALLAEYLPPEIAQRPKQGFRVPLTSWFRNELRDVVSDTVRRADDKLSDWLGEGAIERILQDHLTGKCDRSDQLWALMALQSWLESQFGRQEN